MTAISPRHQRHFGELKIYKTKRQIRKGRWTAAVSLVTLVGLVSLYSAL